MAEFLLGRIKFVYQGAWADSTPYVVDDVVTVSGKTYICISNHTSSSLFDTDLNNIAPRWNIVADGQTWRGDWSTSEYYNTGDLVKYYGIVYQCKVAHESAALDSDGLEVDSENWDVFANAFNWRNSWAVDTFYHVGDIVNYGGYVYYCTDPHVSASTEDDGLEIDSGSWQTFNAGLTFLGTWTDGVRYRVNDVVRSGSDLWICVNPHTAATDIDTGNFEILVNGLEFINSWSISTHYLPGDIATYGGYSYVALTENTGSTPTSSPLDWTPFTTGFRFVGDWNDSTDYLVGDVIRLHGYTYVATADSTSEVPPNEDFWQQLNSGVFWTNSSSTYTELSTTNVTVTNVLATGAEFTVERSNTAYILTKTASGSNYTNGDVIKIAGSSLGGLSPSNDVTITVTGVTLGAINAFTYNGVGVTWNSGVDYILGDIAFFGASSYICIQNHTSGSGNRPDADTTGLYWNTLAAGAETAVLTTAGDTVYQGPNGAVRLPIGTNGQILRSTNGYPVWSNYGLINNVVYVGPLGADIPAPDNGLTIDTPWKTVQYACQQIEDGYQSPNAKTLLRINKQFLLKEVSNYITYTYSAAVTGTSGSAFTSTNTAGLTVGMPVSFTAQTGSLQIDGSSFTSDTIYYVKAIVPNTSFTVSGTHDGTVLSATGTGTATATFTANSPESIERDASTVVDSIVFDLSHGGTAKTTAAAIAYYASNGTEYVNDAVSYEIPQIVGALSYLSTLVVKVLENIAPSNNYQTLNGISVGDQAKQHINSLTAENGAAATLQNLINIITDGLQAGATSAIPTALNPNTSISIKTGTYNEVLPINLPVNTALVGDELRSTVIQPAKADPLLATVAPKNAAVLTRIQTLLPDLLSNTPITPTVGNTATQVTTLPAGDVGSDTAVTSIIDNCNTLYTIVDTGIGSLPAFDTPAPTGYNTTFLSGFGDGKAQIVQNYAFIQDEISSYMASEQSDVWDALSTEQKDACARDVGYILDAICYDMTYGGNTQTLIAGSSYYQFYSLTIAATEKSAAVEAYGWLKGFIDNIVLKTVSPAWGPKYSALSQVVAGTAGSTDAATFAQDRVQDVIDWITTGAAPAAIAPSLTAASVSADLQTAFAAVQSAKAQIQLDATAWVKKYYQALTFHEATCSRDVGYIVDALSYDLAFGSNFATIKAGMAYYRATASAELVLAEQKTAQLGMVNFILNKVKTVAASGAVVQASGLIDDILNYIAGTGYVTGTLVEVNGQTAYNNTLQTINGAEILRANTTFLASEAVAWMDANYGGAVASTNGTTNVIHNSSAHNFVAGDPVVFTGTPGISNIQTGVTYYVLASGLTSTDFAITETYGSTTPVDLATVGSLSLSVAYSYSVDFAKSDVSYFINGIVYDLQYTGNYRSLRYAQVLKNAINGSLTSDMFLVRNATGIRNMTVSGLTGTLGAANEYGSKRPTAGAYVSLDPGFGPWDTSAWVLSRSCYVQNVTTFGTGCTGAKIDGALHAGGNRSIVANDFTQVLSDGIGVWCTGSNSLTELVSVFSYYGYAGYLAELGGRIRATNGNSSYGTYGVIAEGTDSTEVPLYATLNNRAPDAQISSVITDGTNKVLRFEYSNAGASYTNASYSITGSGYQADAIGDEFRDASAFEVRTVDLDDGNGYGGTGYLSASNAAQNGATGYVTIAASDIQLSLAYTGERIYITAGTGVGQYATILKYTNANKVAQIVKESFTTLAVTNTTVTNNLLTVASTASLYAGMPIYVDTTVNGLTAYTVYYVNSANFSGTQFQVSTTAGGAGTAVTITTTGSVTMNLYAAGWDHVVPGTTIVDGLDLTSAYIIEPKVTFTAPGYTATARSLIGSTAWQNVAYGDGKYVAITSNGTNTDYSADGITWSAGGSLSNTTWADVVFGGGSGTLATAVVGGLGGLGATFQAVLGTGALAGQVVSVTVLTGGDGYLTPPTITFDSGTGAGATATCTVLDGAIQAVNVTIPGSGYATPPTVAARTDIITSLPVSTYGNNYTTIPSVTVADPFTGSVWTSGGTGTLNSYYYFVDGSTKNWYQATVGGVFSTTAPTFTSGSQSNGGATLTYVGTTASGTAVLSNHGVRSITLDIAGAGYTTTPVVTVLDTNAKFVAIGSGVATTAYSTVADLGSAWTTSVGQNLPSADFTSVTFGGGTWVAVGGTSTVSSAAASSDDGATWVTRSITSLAPAAGVYSSVAYGNNTFVAISTGNTGTSYSTNGISWTNGGALPASTTWTSVAYGNGRFVALATTGRVAISTDVGVTWSAVPTAVGATTSILSSNYDWTKIAYGQGLFFAIANGTVAATSSDGINWTLRTMPGSSTNWNSIVFGNSDSKPLWVAVSKTSGTVAASIRTGATTQGRIKTASGVIAEIRLVEPGSGYPKGEVTGATITTNVILTSDTTNLVDSQPVEFTGLDSSGLLTGTTYYVIGSTISANTSFKVSATAGSSTPVTVTASTSGLSGTYVAAPIITQVDPNKSVTAATRIRMGDGVLGNPSFTNRGTNNATATAVLTGDGYGDIYQPSTYISVSNLFAIPTAGANIVFSSIDGTYYKLVQVTNIAGIPGNYTAQFQINPSLTVLNAPAHNTQITTTLKYSQVRLTGHDFLYIGTGNFNDTNYPNVNIAAAVTANQEHETAGGRVFFTSTDQDGNFNVGNLFGVQQATGTATLNATAFNLAGLQSLQLGSVTIGSNSAVITQFSTDPYFTANSDSIIPTQKAIKAYITSQIGGGQSNINVNTLTAGVIYVANNNISTTSGIQIRVASKMYFVGGIDGAAMAVPFFMQR